MFLDMELLLIALIAQEIDLTTLSSAARSASTAVAAMWVWGGGAYSLRPGAIVTFRAADSATEEAEDVFTTPEESDTQSNAGVLTTWDSRRQRGLVFFPGESASRTLTSISGVEEVEGKELEVVRGSTQTAALAISHCNALVPLATPCRLFPFLAPLKLDDVIPYDSNFQLSEGTLHAIEVLMLAPTYRPPNITDLGEQATAAWDYLATSLQHSALRMIEVLLRTVGRHFIPV